MNLSFLTSGVWIVVAALVLGNCGAQQSDAPPVESSQNCAPVDAQIATVLELIQGGHLDGLRQVIEVDVDADLRRAVLEFAFDLIGALPNQIWSELQNFSASSSSGALMTVLAQILRFIDGAIDQVPRYHVAEPLRNVIGTCTHRDMLEWIHHVINDAQVRSSLETILSDPDDVILLISNLGIDFNDGASKTAVLSLITGMLTSVGTPGFSVDPLVDLFHAILSTGLVNADSDSIQSFLFLLEYLLGPPTQALMISNFVACSQISDPQNYLIELLYDLVNQNIVSIGSIQEILGNNQSLFLILDAFLAFLVESPDAWPALRTAVTQLLVADVAPKALPDIATLIETDALAQILSLLASLATGCNQ